MKPQAKLMPLLLLPPASWGEASCKRVLYTDRNTSSKHISQKEAFVTQRLYIKFSSTDSS